MLIEGSPWLRFEEAAEKAGFQFVNVSKFHFFNCTSCQHFNAHCVFFRMHIFESSNSQSYNCSMSKVSFFQHVKSRENNITTKTIVMFRLHNQVVVVFDMIAV